MSWYVLCTKPRKEKFLAKRLSELGMEVYCPTVLRKREWSDRIKTVEEPLLPCYCFVNIAASERSRVFVIPGIVRYLHWLGKPAIVKDEEIALIQMTLEQCDHNSILVEAFVPNERIRIKSGAFAGQTGTIVNQQGKKISIYIDSMQMCIKADRSAITVARSQEYAFV